MPLNYNKWDNLELSDDSDVEVHPNVDKKSFIRWKQRDIHEKREERKGKIAFLHSEVALNETLLPRLDELISRVESEGLPYYSRTVAQLQATKGDPKADRPASGRPDQPSYDDMMLALMTTVADEVKGKLGSGIDEERRAKELKETLQTHRRQLLERTEQCKKDIVKEEAEQRRHITSEDMKVGWDSGHVNKNAASAQIVDPIKPAPKTSSSAKATKAKTTDIEVLNPVSSGSQADVVPAKSGYSSDGEKSDDDDDDDDDEEVPILTPSAKRFTQLETGNWEASFKAISSEPGLLHDDINDAILMEAFEACMRGEAKYARACVHQSLVLQYCRKLGKDGVSLFFKRMATNAEALRVFQNDVKQTFDRIVTRSKEMKAEREAAGVNSAGEREQIQLVAQDPSTVITFEVPDGPPPETFTLEGEGSEEMDVEKVREFLQKRWEIYESFPKNLKKALKSKSLEEVNRVLGRMAVEEGEETVQKLDEAGILSFSSTDIVDQTQNQQQTVLAGEPGPSTSSLEQQVDDASLVD